MKNHDDLLARISLCDRLFNLIYDEEEQVRLSESERFLSTQMILFMLNQFERGEQHPGQRKRSKPSSKMAMESDTGGIGAV